MSILLLHLQFEAILIGILKLKFPQQVFHLQCLLGQSVVVARQVLKSRVCPSFPLSECFLGIESLVFSEFWHGARNPNDVVRDRTRFFF